MEKNIGIVQINDSHANLYPLEDAFYGPAGFEFAKMGGYAKVMTKIQEYKQKDKNLLIFDNGDTFHGTYEAIQSEGQVMVPYLNKLGIDAMTFHWDIAYGPERLKELEKELSYPILAANVYYEGTKDLLFNPYHIFEIDGLKIGVIGLASNIIRSNMPKKFWEGTEYTDGIEETRTSIDTLKDQNVHLILVLSHLGYPQDIDLIHRVPGIDIYLSGHTHNRIKAPVKINDTYIIQSGALATSIGYLNLTFESDRLAQIDHEFIYLDDSVEASQDIVDMLKKDPILNEHADYLDEDVGESAIDLHRASSLYGTMDYLLLDAVQKATGRDIAFSNGWRYGGAIRKGKLTRRHLHQIVPMDPEIMTADLTGKEIFDMLEENLENTFSCEPFHQKGGYIKRNVGLRVYCKLENPFGQRIQKIFVGDQELDLEQTYPVAYLTRQGVPETYGKNHDSTGMGSIKAMEDYLKDQTYHREDLDSYILV